MRSERFIKWFYGLGFVGAMTFLYYMMINV